MKCRRGDIYVGAEHAFGVGEIEHAALELFAQMKAVFPQLIVLASVLKMRYSKKGHRHDGPG